MANEADVRSRVGKFLRECGYFVQAMETGAIADGVPDMFYSHHGDAGAIKHHGWLELKKVRVLPKKPGTSLFKSLNHDLGIYQINWITACIAAGTPCNILVAYERRYFFVPGELAEEFNGFTWERLQEFEIKKVHLPYKLRCA